jgi:hypothetical protein
VLLLVTKCDPDGTFISKAYRVDQHESTGHVLCWVELNNVTGKNALGKVQNVAFWSQVSSLELRKVQPKGQTTVGTPSQQPDA